MKIKCDYCGNYLSDTDEKCPNCTAPNAHLRRVGIGVPKTIEELKIWYQEHNLPDEEITRFFIGKDIKEARAFGIYFDEKSGNYIVYKNKGSGERAIRYEGKDEAYAVHELYLKLREEIQNQKSNNANHSTSRSRGYHKIGKIFAISFMVCYVLILYVIPIFGVIIVNLDSILYPNYLSGYYESNGTLYYLYDKCESKKYDSCEWYKFNEKEQTWSLFLNKEVKKPKKGGYSWNEDNKLYRKYHVERQFTEEDWYKELHPPTPVAGYYKYDDKVYYYLGRWYVYQNQRWQWASAPSGDIVPNPDSYYDYSYSKDDTYSFKDSSYYKDYLDRESYHSSSRDDSSWSSSSSWDDDDWDSGSSWDSDSSWDSGSTDWDSDW